MDHTITNKLLQYFLRKQNPTDEEKDFVFQLCRSKGMFPVTFVCREDFEGIGYEAPESDETMQRIVGIVEDIYLDGGLWQDLKYAAEQCDLKKTQEE